MQTQEITFAEFRYNDIQKIFYCFILMCLCFVSSAQKHAVIKLKDCEAVIYNVYGNGRQNLEHIPLCEKVKNDTAFADVILIYDQEIQGKKIKLKSAIADSFLIEQSYKMTLECVTEEGHREAYQPCNYYSVWKPTKSIAYNKFRILDYEKTDKKLVIKPYKIDSLDIKVMKKFAKKFYKEVYGKDYKVDYNSFIKNKKKVSDFMHFVLNEIHLRITLFKKGKKVGERFIVFEYWYGC